MGNNCICLDKQVIINKDISCSNLANDLKTKTHNNISTMTNIDTGTNYETTFYNNNNFSITEESENDSASEIEDEIFISPHCEFDKNMFNLINDIRMNPDYHLGILKKVISSIRGGERKLYIDKNRND